MRVKGHRLSLMRRRYVVQRRQASIRPPTPPHNGGGGDAPPPLQLYNSLTRSLEPLPVDQPFACYTCGPTVYAPAHLGHARTYVWVDVLRRLLEHRWSARATAPPLFVMNVTDVDDKILQAAAAQGEPPLALARRFEDDFWRDLEALHCRRPHVAPRVSDYVDSAVVPFVRDLLRRGIAYARSDGVYFDVAAYERRSRRPYLPFRRGRGGEAAVATEAPDGADDRDFALWKRHKPGEALCWDGPVEHLPGRPGWHIECSAMIRAVQAQIAPVPFHLHIGGVDLQFPHHTNEIAQSQALQCCGADGRDAAVDEAARPWIPHWMHTGHLHIDGRKMSKSLKNFITIEDLLRKATDGGGPFASGGDDFRWWCLQSRYREPCTFTMVQLAQARDQRLRLVQFLVDAAAVGRRRRIYERPWSSRDREMLWTSNEAYGRCLRALHSDLDGHTFRQELMELVEKGAAYIQNSSTAGASVETAQAVAQNVRELCRLIGFSNVTSDAGLALDSSSSQSLVVGGESVLLDTFVEFRASVRKAAIDCLRQDAANEGVQKIIQLCDDARGTTFPALGIELLDDKASNANGLDTSLWKPCLPRVGTDKNHDVQNDEGSTQHLARDDLLSIPVDLFFKEGMYVGQFLEFDELGLPTINSDGSKVSNRQRQKLQKKLEKHKKRLEAAKE